ncbi:DNA repair protein RAD51 homolog 3 [Calliphora vicina]|uniref:DNA repair protein RAD51 homolog 3 n=1 Tax=Calliphora vicina TaxID=7373 RepID=UPI00325C1554
MFKTTAFEVWRHEQELPKLITLIKELDDNLAGGLPLGIVTELCGAPGTGKTQFCLQLCLNVQFPEQMGGLGGKAFYIDTNQDFSPYRLKELAEDMEQRFQHTFKKLYSNIASPSASSQIHNFQAGNLLKNVSYVYCTNYTDLMAIIHNFRNIFKEDLRFKLIIIDSFSFCIRQLDDVKLRTRIIYEILNDLQILAVEYNVAVIITNELTTRHIDNNWIVAPALGDSHTHKINQRLILSQEADKEHRVVLIDKSVLCDKIAVRFKITSNGIRSI